jgi:polyisoprenoid-binding protein YceI
MSAEPATVTTALPTGTWTVDPVHSNVEFSVKHVGIATVKGRFNQFEGTLEVGPDGPVGHGSVEVQSIDTGEAARDDHLRSPDFFDVANFPKIAFRSTDIAVDGESLAVTGEITIHGVSRTITLEGELEGSETDHQGQQRVGLSLSAQIKRSDFDMRFNAALGSGNLVVSDKVKIQVDVSAVKAG